MTGVAVRDAATVMLVRDTAASKHGDHRGLEVFMLRRNLNAEFMGGAYVFPGGAVDEADRHVDLEDVCEGRSDADASRLLGIEEGGLAYWVAAIRECFEEAGVLLAYDGGGEIVPLGDGQVSERFARHRAEVWAGTRRMVDVCEREGLRLAADSIHYFSHWITPEGAPRRYDTRFFVAAAPVEQAPVHDERETIANVWIRPEEALDRHRRGEFDLILPTIKNLEAIARFERASDLLDAAASAASVPTVQPRITADSHGVRILLPGDPGYDEARPPPEPVAIPTRPSGGERA